MTTPFPENLLRAHAESERLKGESIVAITASENLSFHAHVIERTANLLYFFAHDGGIRSDDDRIVRVLGMRGFNDIMTASNLILGGYYQPAIMIARDLLELNFLLDDFTHDKSLIEKWRTLTGKEYDKIFKPVSVRERLDQRDGFTGMKRAEIYKLMSSVAGHPSPAGFQMLLRPDGNYFCGPFFELRSLDACWSELAKIAMQIGGHFQRFFEVRSKETAIAKIEYLELQNRWLEHFFGKAEFDLKMIAEMRALADALPDKTP
ncbi:MAG TPA: hypothetical protein VJS47_01305 [Rhizomicrobium sp.]|nr:hypothetical protein [Rhizomicrobium sp.]